MLGKVVVESSGKVTNVKVLEYAGDRSKLEVDLQGRGMLTDTSMTEISSYWQEFRRGAILYGEGGPVWLTDDGDVLSWNGFGVGKPTGRGFAASYAVCGAIQVTAERFAHLNGVALIGEYTIDEEGNYRWTLWEWKPAEC